MKPSLATIPDEILNKSETVLNQKRTILIVDDEQDGRRILEMVLNSSDYQLSFARSGKEALDKAFEVIPDLILLDVMMPDMDGFEVCRRLRADPLLAEVPIVMVTALDHREALLEGFQAGADDFITKPFDHIELKARVRTITRLNRYRHLIIERIKFDWVIDQAMDGYIIIDETDTILYTNPKARLYLNQPAKSKNKISGQFLELVQKHYHCQPQEAWTNWPHPAPNEAIRYLVRPESVNANPFWLQVNVLKLPTATKDNFVIHLTNVTEQMTMQRDMQSFHKMMSHKLRTPLISMVGSLELIAEHLDRLNQEEIANFLQTSLYGARRLQNQIEDILQYLTMTSVAQSGYGFALQTLKPLIEKIKKELKLKSVTVSCPKQLQQTQIFLSKQMMEIILWEIMENSKKFHPQQSPTIKIKVRSLNSKQIVIHISDDGQHLSPEQLDQVWQPYYQGEKYFTGEVAGMGLGLSMIALAIWQTGGDYHIYNQEEQPGVVVELILPTFR